MNQRPSFVVNLSPRVVAGFKVVEEKIAPGFEILSQVHGGDGFEVQSHEQYKGREGDFLCTQTSLGLGIFVADCTAILVYGRKGGIERVSAIHAGWRGTAKGVIQNAINSFEGFEEIVAWMSPSICAEHFEVHDDVLEALGPESKEFAHEFQNKKFHFDLSSFQKRILDRKGVRVLKSSLCTFCQPDLVSYRRSGGVLKARQLAYIRLQSKG